MNKPLKVVINCEVPYPQGGLESALIGLISALGQLEEDQEEYILVAPWQRPDWIRPFAGKNQSIVVRPRPVDPQPDLSEIWKRRLGPIRPVLRSIKKLIVRQPVSSMPNPNHSWPQVPVSDGFYESLHCEVLHIPFQNFILCSLPTIYNPHDLQHLHYPQFFSASTLAWRETIYPAGCHFAQTVAVASNWIKEDIQKHYHISADKIQVIPFGPPTSAYESADPVTVQEIRKKYHLLEPFCFYPAYTWPHKNHIRLLEALSLVRSQSGLTVNLVCSGVQTEFWRQIKGYIEALQLENQVKFLGNVPRPELRALYALAQFVIIPTLFEASSLPIYEAWLESVPVACSTVTSLPEQAGDAALLFDPLSVPAIAEAITTLAAKPEAREDLRVRGTRRLKDFSWERTAKAYRAVYRRAAGRILTEEDCFLLNWDWMGNPQRIQQTHFS